MYIYTHPPFIHLSIHTHNMTKYAVLIGINYTGSSCPLNGCVNDALNMRKFVAAHGFHDANIVMMTDNARVTRDPSLLPTRDNIWRQLDLAVSKLRSGDTLFVSFSGHGGSRTDLDGASDETDGLDETIYCLDAIEDESRVIVDDELKSRVVNKIPPGARFRGFMDCCHSGTCFDLKYNFVRGKRVSQEGTQSAQSDDILVLSGCADDSYSNDSCIAGQACGAMTWSFLDTMKEGLDSITWRELCTIMRLKLKQGGYDQTPQLSFATRKLLDKKFDL